VCWQLAGSLGLVSAQKVPSPTTVWATAVHLVTTDSAAYGTLQAGMAASLERVSLGFFFGGALAVLLAVVAGLSRLGENAVDPPMQMLRTLPLFGLVPVFIVWFGIGQLPKVLLIALAASIPLYLNTFAGIRSVDAKLAELGQVLQLKRSERLRYIAFPGALPQALVGLRQSLGVAWLALVVAEQLNVSNGLGFMINQATQFLQNDVIFVVLIVYTILGLLTDALVRQLELPRHVSLKGEVVRPCGFEGATSKLQLRRGAELDLLPDVHRSWDLRYPADSALSRRELGGCALVVVPHVGCRCVEKGRAPRLRFLTASSRTSRSPLAHSISSTNGQAAP
jgi:sulfonate transport system permease protein